MRTNNIEAAKTDFDSLIETTSHLDMAHYLRAKCALIEGSTSSDSWRSDADNRRLQASGGFQHPVSYERGDPSGCIRSSFLRCRES